MSLTNKKLNTPINTPKNTIELVGNPDDVHNYYKFIVPTLNVNPLSGPSEMKTNIEEFYNDVHDIENNIIYIEENFMEQINIPTNEEENEEYEICFSTDDEDEEIETNEWMFNY